MVKLVSERLKFDDLKVVEAKIIKDRITDRPRGFGYIEVETLEMLQALMDLNDTGVTLAGRRIQLDVSSSRSQNSNNRGGGDDRRRSGTGNNRGGGGGFGEIDGSQFRGGRHNNHHNS